MMTMFAKGFTLPLVHRQPTARERLAAHFDSRATAIERQIERLEREAAVARAAAAFLSQRGRPGERTADRDDAQDWLSARARRRLFRNREML